MKKINKKLIAFILLMAITIPLLNNNFGVFANSLNKLFSRSTQLNNNEIRILEIQPTNNFSIGDSNEKTGTIQKTVEGEKVIIEHITMTEFIGKVDKINGLYDAIIIGRRTDSSNDQYSFKDYDNMDNDITNRKAEEIKDFILSGQLVYIDESIRENDNNNLDKNTKLYKKLGANRDNEINDLDNVKRIDIEIYTQNNGWQSNLNINDVVSQYKQNEIKKYRLNIIEYPKGDSGTGDGSEESRKLKYKFNISTGDESETSNKVDVKLYLDFNGDGLYKEEEIVDSYESLAVHNTTDIELSYGLNKEFIGHLNWKIEVNDSNNVKSYITSSFKVNRLSGNTKTIRVLQVMESSNSNTSSNGSGGILNLEKNTRFQEFISETLTNFGYDIKIDSIGAEKFYNSDSNNIIVNNQNKQLNGDYDMLIIGFKDWFESAKITNRAIEEMIKFAKTGQGIMLTHDTIYYESGDLNTSYGSNRHNLAKKLADYIGQSRFDNTHNVSNQNISDKTDFTGKIIPHDTDKLSEYSIEAQMGSTIWRRPNKINESTSTQVYRTNNSLITSYPYELGETITVRRTHAQYLQLNFEDEDVVAWYNLTNKDTGYGGTNSQGVSAKINQYDTRNNYYTYSKGNITFSGTGENSRDYIDYPDSEFKLFINTIIKAERGANHAPTISSNIIKSTDKNKADLEISTAQKTIDFQPLVEDIDNDKVDVKVTIEYIDDDGKVVNKAIYDEKSLIQGEKINLIIDNPYYEKTSSQIEGKVITIKVEAQDTKKATASQEYIVKPIMEPTVNLTYENNTGLVGDTIPLTINLEKLNVKENEVIENVKLTISDFSSTITGIKKSQVIDIPDFNSQNIGKYTFENINTTIEGNHEIKFNVNYDIKKGVNIVKKDFDIIVRVYSKEGKIILKTIDSMGNTIQDFVGEANLKSNSGFNSIKLVYGLSGGRYTWPDSTSSKITTSSYSLKIAPKANSSSSNYTVDTYQIKNSEEKVITSGNSSTANIGNITYENPTAEVIYTIKRDKPVITSNNEKLRILEIQPGNKFTITNNSGGTAKPGTEYIVDNDENEKGNIKTIIIDHIPMSEFIGKIDQLNGYYDVIVIGREEYGGKPYRDYSAINDNGKESGYQENDITKRKATEVIEFSKTGQTVYIESSINDAKLKGSNLSNLYTSLTNSRNAKGEVYDELPLQRIVDKYIENTNKRAIISIDSPIGDKSSHIKNTNEEVDILGSLENRSMEFKINLLENQGYTGSYNIKLYLDIDGDGRYTDDELFKSENKVEIYSDGYSIIYNMPIDFIGQLNWKIELEANNSTKIKSYLTGEVNFRRLTEDGKKIVRVLQIRPDKGIDLSTNKEFKQLLDNVKDYNVTIKTVSVSEFNEKANLEYTGQDKITLNGNYDMVILGFADVYGNKDITDTDALNQIEDFIKSGQGVMFTHDTMIYDEFEKSSPQTIRRRFRDYVGQTRFLPLTEKNETDQIFSEGYYTQINSSNIWGRTNKTQSGEKNATQVQQTNSGIITDYPYDLSKNNKTVDNSSTQKSPNTLEVTKTHTQHFQLNFEDPEVVPWYNVKDTNTNDRYFGNNSYDSRNDYYTYSKGNITYSGTGHNTDGTYPISELQLFVNTIIKAERGANHAPVIDSTIEERPNEEYDIEIDHNENYTFKVRATDIDNDKVKIKVSVKGANDEDWSLVVESDYINQGEYITDPVIGKKYWNGNSGKILEVKIEAIDEHNATSVKIYRLLPTNNPQLTIIAQQGKGLVGDEITTTISLQKVNMQGNNDIKINSISLGEYDGSVFADIILPDKDSIVFDNNNGTIQIKTKTISESNKFIPIILEYEVYKKNKESDFNSETYTTKATNTYAPKTVEIKVPISSKNGEVNLKITNDENIQVQPNITLNRNNIEISTVDVNSMSYTWTNKGSIYILSGTYNATINNLQQIGADKISETGQNVTLNYDNPVATIQINISTGKNGQVISHGLLDLKSDTYTIKEYDEENLEANAIQGMYYRIGTEIEIGRINSVLEVTVPSTVNIDIDKIQLYETYNNGNKKIKSISNSEQFIVEDNVIKVTNLCKGKTYLLSYVAKFDDNSDLSSQLVNETEKRLLRIILKKETEDSSYLPELF